MANIYPPIINRTLPPITYTSPNFTFNIPFKHNIFFSLPSGEESFEMFIKISPLLGDRYGISKIISVNLLSTDTLINKTIHQATDGLGSFLVPSQFYKIQLAYSNGEGAAPSSYSTIGIAKYISTSNISVKIREGTSINYFNCNNTFTGEYTNTDASERVIAYKFDILERSTNIIYETSGKLPHNANVMGMGEIDDKGKLVSTDIFHTKRILNKTKSYIIKYTIYTINGYEKTVQSDLNLSLSGSTDFKGKIIPEVKYENGYINIKIEATTVDSITGTLNPIKTGTYLISRSSKEDNYQIWDWMAVKTIPENTYSIDFWKDFTVEQGVNYKYSMQDYDINSQKPLSVGPTSIDVQADFEDIFLFDGERQLKIKYNQKVDNFKIAQLENKTDTIGGAYPFLSKNGNIRYKTFSISGLICSQMDDFNYFTLDTSPYIYTFGHSTENIKKERDFKLKVLEWLNNGKPKLFRSPTEGNYIIILQNVSLSSNDSLGRLLHNFSATVYEICEYTIDNLKKYNILNNNVLNEQSPLFGLQSVDIIGGPYALGDKRTRTQQLPRTL